MLAKEINIYNASHVVLYQYVVERIFPSILGIPFLVAIIRSDKRHPLIVMFVAFCLVYIFGGYSKLWAYGRIISFIVLILHISTAVGIAQIESKPWWNGSWLIAQKISTSSLIILFLFSYSYKGLIQPVLERSLPGNQNTYHRYEWLSEYVGQYDVVLADMSSNGMIPAFSGKVVAVNHPLPFIPDIQERIKDVNHFFHDTTTVQDRLLIARKYHVSFLLIDKYQVLNWREIKQSLLRYGNIVFENKEFVLISLSEIKQPDKSEPEMIKGHFRKKSFAQQGKYWMIMILNWHY